MNARANDSPTLVGWQLRPHGTSPRAPAKSGPRPRHGSRPRPPPGPRRAPQPPPPPPRPAAGQRRECGTPPTARLPAGLAPLPPLLPPPGRLLWASGAASVSGGPAGQGPACRARHALQGGAQGLGAGSSCSVPPVRHTPAAAGLLGPARPAAAGTAPAAGSRPTTHLHSCQPSAPRLAPLQCWAHGG